MNKMKYIAAFLVPVIIMYCLSAIVAWDANPGNWNTVCRFFVTFIAFIVGTVFLAQTINSDENQS